MVQPHFSGLSPRGAAGASPQCHCPCEGSQGHDSHDRGANRPLCKSSKALLLGSFHPPAAALFLGSKFAHSCLPQMRRARPKEAKHAPLHCHWGLQGEASLWRLVPNPPHRSACQMRAITRPGTPQHPGLHLPTSVLGPNSGFQRFRIVLLALSWLCELSTKGGKGSIEVPSQELTEREGWPHCVHLLRGGVFCER